ncbi:MAG: cytochrome c [Rhodobacteraceae bacterium]|nr:cytochrome c [Paracoccaceae bacterium]
MAKSLIALAAGAAVVASAIAAVSHTGATGVVLQRMEAMSEMSASMRVLGPMMQGRTDWNADALRAAAELIAGHGAEMTELFPEGTGGAPSRATPAVWSEWDEFARLADLLKAASTALAASADQGMVAGDAESSSLAGELSAGTRAATEALLAQLPNGELFRLVNQTCSGCHSKYRGRRN